jgi:hypothetical protein
MNDEVERIWKEVVMAYFKILSRTLPEETEEKHDSRCTSRGLNQTHPEYKFRALLATCFHAGFLLGLFFHPEDGGAMFLRNVS